jgi:hypothetical protein
MQVLNPTGASEITRLHAPRVDTLNGKTIGVLSNDVWQAHRTLPLVCELLKQQFPNSAIAPLEDVKLGNEAIEKDETADLVKKRGWDAVVIGNAS